MHCVSENSMIQNMRRNARIVVAVAAMLSTSACTTSDIPESSASTTSNSPVITMPDCTKFQTKYKKVVDEALTSYAEFQNDPSDANRIGAKMAAITQFHFITHDSTGCASAPDKAAAQARLDQLP